MALAIVAGYFGGFALAFFCGRWILKRASSEVFSRRLGAIFGLLSVIPALFLGTVIGGNFGGAFGETILLPIGLGTLGVPVGLGIGLAFVIVLVVCIGTAVGAGVGKLVHDVVVRYRAI